MVAIRFIISWTFVIFHSLCSATVDHQLCHMAAGFEDSSVVLWSLNGYENYGRKPFQSFEDRLCQWSINNCNRILTEDLSDYENEEEIVTNLKDACGEEETDMENGSSSSTMSRQRWRRRVSNKYKRTVTVKQQWDDYAAKSCSENNLWVLIAKFWYFLFNFLHCKSYSAPDSQSIVLRGHRNAVTDVTFGKKNGILLSVSRDKTFRLWKADSYTCACVYR